MEWRDIAQKISGDGNVTVCRESFGSEETASKPLDEAGVRELFPGVLFSQNDSAIYVPAKLCHSFPVRNAKGRGFFPVVLANSVHTVMDTLVDIEHQITNGGIGNTDNICGHIKAASFKQVELADVSSVPDEAIPVYALYCLYGRHKQIPSIVDKYMSGQQKWSTSMEVFHDWKDAAFLYEGEAIPIKDAPTEMLECVDKDKVKYYKGKQMSVALGGIDGSVEFLGAALTMYPADEQGHLLGMFGGRALEAASLKCCMPVSFGEFKKPEEAKEFVDRKCTELASIQVLGNSDPDELDGHVHPILTDGTVLPVNGHDHQIQSFVLSPGTKPLWTGRLTTHYDWIRSSVDETSRDVVHSHTFKVDLKKKLPKLDTVNEASEDDTELASFAISNPEEFDVKLKELEALLQKVNGVVGRLDGSSSTDATELASLRDQLTEAISDEKVKEMVEAEIASKVESGELIEKDEHDEAVAKTKDDVKKEFEEKEKQEKKTAERLKQVSDLGIELEHEIAEGKTIKTVVESFGHDESGDDAFETQYGSWKLAADAMKKFEAKANEETQETETASKPKEKKGFLAGQPTEDLGGGGGTETASTNTGVNNKPKVGKNAITSV